MHSEQSMVLFLFLFQWHKTIFHHASLDWMTGGIRLGYIAI